MRTQELAIPCSFGPPFEAETIFWGIEFIVSSKNRFFHYEIRVY
jgi:hypothetical protein